MSISRFLGRLGALLGAAVLAFAAHAAPTTQLGFLIDRSGSISDADFNTMKAGYVAALAALPTDGSIELTVYSFGNSATQVIAPVVVTAGNLAGLQATISAMGRAGAEATFTAAGITAISTAMVTSSNWNVGLASIINIATDGVPNDGTANPQANAVAAALAAEARGIDALTAEFIGSAAGGLDALRDIVFSPLNGPCANCGTLLAAGSTPPNPMTSQPWVLPVNSFDDFGAAILAKVQAITQVPEPGALSLAALALVGLGLTRRQARQA